ncbi:MAG TPA: hypothetical protein VNA16_06410 [Abditibacteriaceae bacterium]|nr:hypothetical protein [Abditibacteriaceae bacterium]
MRNPVHIGGVVRNAVLFNFKNWRGKPGGDAVSVDSLLQTVADLFGLLHTRQIDYRLVGGIALLQYVEGRNTEGIDLIVAAADLKTLPEIEITSQDNDFARGVFNGLRVDFLLTRNPLFNKIRQDYTMAQRFLERDIPCATVEGLLLLKLYALPALYRLGNFARVGLYENDIATLLHDYRPRLEPLFEELAGHLSGSDLDAVRKIATEIQQRVERFEKETSPGA